MAKTGGGIVPRDLPAIDRYTAFFLQKHTIDIETTTQLSKKIE